MQIIDTKLKGCFEIQPAIHKDLRGEFVKTFHLPTFSKACVSERDLLPLKMNKFISPFGYKQEEL
jgi:dTDP-4-dehydrorhamnose 3,5-epimerase-like enzyme